MGTLHQHLVPWFIIFSLYPQLLVFNCWVRDYEDSVRVKNYII